MHKPINAICGKVLIKTKTARNPVSALLCLICLVFSCQNDSCDQHEAHKKRDKPKKNIIFASPSSCSVPDLVQERIIPIVWHCLPQQRDLWRGNCNWQMGKKDKKKKKVSFAQEEQRGRDEGKHLTGTQEDSTVRADLLVNLHCLQKAAGMSEMRKPLALDKKVMSGNERQ